MNQQNLIWLAVIAGIGVYLYSRKGTTFDPAGAVVETVQGAISGWQNVNSGPTWVPVIADVEQSVGIPTGLLQRQAYQESAFREAVIRGTHASSAGALGILQMVPKYFTSVRAPIPFSDDAVNAQINEAAQTMAGYYQQYDDWGIALAAYNAGPGAVAKYGGIPPYTETQNYVAAILKDVPGLA